MLMRVADDGFLAIDANLRSAGGPPDVFAAGDVATSVTHPRPKAGVFAVRQGPLLAANLRRHLCGQPLRRFRPQARWLSLISTGSRSAIATRAWLAISGAWLWRWKDRIDRAFMARFSTELPAMRRSPPALRSAATKQRDRRTPRSLLAGGAFAITAVGTGRHSRIMSGQ